MKNKIYNYFFKEFLSFFIIILFALTSIVWAVQAVNYLDLVTEDGHTFSIYFGYSILTIPKTITKLLPFTFLTAIIATILKFEKDNELIVLWTSGINKIRIVNIIFIISVVITLFQIVLASTISPATLNLSRTLLKNSELNFFSSLLRERKFNDTVKNLTIFADKKNPDGTVENIFLRDDTSTARDENLDEVEKSTNNKESSTIIAKKGYLKKKGDLNILVLFDGVIQKETADGQINFLNFSKTEYNLSQFATKTVTWAKVQERTSLSLFKCLFAKTNYDSYIANFIFNYLDKATIVRTLREFQKDCPYKAPDIINEVNRRLGMPLYIPLLALVACFLLSSRKEHTKIHLLKYLYFLVGFLILVFAEISVRYSGKFLYVTILYYLTPVLIAVINYFVLFKIFKYENLR